MVKKNLPPGDNPPLNNPNTQTLPEGKKKLPKNPKSKRQQVKMGKSSTTKEKNKENNPFQCNWNPAVGSGQTDRPCQGWGERLLLF